MYYAITTSLLLLLIPATSFLLTPPHSPSHTLRSTKSLDFEAIRESVDSLPSPPPLDPTYDVFCNRELNMNSLAAIGFDMDYTLAQYHVPEFDNLAFDGAKQKLVDMGYPEEVLKFTYEPSKWIRGLIIDIKRGNFLKIDKHKYTRVAYHGSQEMSSEARKALYAQTFNKKDSFGESYYINMDTLFQIVDAELYSQLIDLKDSEDSEYEFLDGKTYEEMYRDARACVDLCHRDGVIKDEVAKNPSKYVVKDPNMVPMLKQYKEKGIKVFLVTNSLWTYTQDVMSYLVDPSDTESGDWTDLFDLIIVGSCKPAFLVDPRRDLFRVDKQTGQLTNTDGVYEIAALNPNGATKFLEQGNVYQNGNFNQLAAMLDLDGKAITGEQILYVGDHLYSDVLRSKRTLGWRTALIVPELEEEMKTTESQKDTSSTILKLRKLRESISVKSNALRLAPDTPENSAQLESLETSDRQIKEALVDIVGAHHKAYNPIWGQLFKAGYEDSRFAYYTANYACLYMTKASNLRFVSDQRAFRTFNTPPPHANTNTDEQ
ncbi:hypothetical protein TrLO_g16022 [Triparma laevis f. longispina]|uniref:5'-nucleotidase n=1 Tax=Triparma laevis f. longispina TaxID=1714387 RepID=A0A9W7BZI7_9STRA|nr:hypothetical protein TrLO_g16022 [Triparma laevis f. longispina]